MQSYLDTDVATGSTYFYRLEAVDLDGRSTFFGPVSATTAQTVLRNRLGASRPNPFGANAAAIAFDLAKRGRTRMTVYDAAGRRVRTIVDEVLDPGSHVRWWDGRDEQGVVTAPGVYFYRLQTPEFTASRRLVRVR
jgi:hypothetical protein